MKEKIKSNLVTLIGIAAGAAGGYLYWHFIGCASGTCPLTSNWITMLIYGSLTGGLLGNLFQDKILEIKRKKNPQE